MTEKLKQLIKKECKKIEEHGKTTIIVSAAKHYGWDPEIFEDRYIIREEMQKRGYKVFTQVANQMVSYIVKNK